MKKVYLAVCAVVVLGLSSCATMPTPATQEAVVNAASYAAAKAACEKQGKDYKCKSPMKDCECVKRPEPVPTTTPAPAPNPVPPQPTPTPTPEPKSEPVPASSPSGCVSHPPHDEGGWWTMNECGPVGGSDDYIFDVSGWPAPKHGKLSFKAKGIDSGQMREDPAFVIIHAKLKEPQGSYSTWMFAMSSTDTFMLAVRQHDCYPRGWCEGPDHAGAKRWYPDVTYSFDCVWDEAAQASCVAFDDHGNEIVRMSVPTWGVITGYIYFAIGNQAEHNYPQAAMRTPVVLTDIKLEVKD